MQARYYDPVIGRFYSNDPVGYTAKNPVMSFNRYMYVNNNPYKYTDPNGEFLDIILDVGFIAYDLYDMATNGVNETNSASLAANVAGALIPGATGLGLAARAGKKVCCFVAGTQVLTEDGYKNIEDIELGEKLWAKNVETGEQDWKPITKIFNEPDRGIFEIKLKGVDDFEQRIETTDDHPFYVVGAGWKTTIELKIGDQIETDGNDPMEVVSVIDEKRQTLTYNFTVADFHTYYVTKKNVLVHNCPTGSYTNTHASGKTYDGKGDPSRADASAKRIEKQTGDPAVKTETRTASSDRESFKQESRSLDGNGGAGSDSNYNKIESPGKKYRKQDGEN
jgi:hypothetical protein